MDSLIPDVKFYRDSCSHDDNVTHWHFDCPVCKFEYAGTSIYVDVQDGFYEDDRQFECNMCHRYY